MDDIDRLRAALAALEPEAAALPWAAERRWTCATHVRWEGELPLLDLHDLNARLAGRAVEAAAAVGGELETGALRIVTGRGRRSIGPGVLGQIASGKLAKARDQQGWSYHPSGAGAYVLVTDPARAPRSATGGLGWGCWLAAAAAIALFLWTLFTR